jgi:hypothetical protein
MGYRFEFDSQNNLLRCSWDGVVTDDLLWENFCAARNLVASHSFRRCINNFSGVTRFDATTTMIERIARMPPTFGGAGTMLIIVAPKDLIFGLSRMFSTLSEPTRPNLHVVHTEQEAFTLLGITSAHFTPVSDP